MFHYLKLQKNLIHRAVVASGINAGAVYLLSAVLFFGGSAIVYEKTNHANWLVFLTAISSVTHLSTKRRTDFLKLTFGDARAKWVRIIENSILSIPFVVVLLIHGEWLFAIACILTLAALSLLQNRSINSWVLPTPFSKKPFEFSTGFRRSFILLIAVYVLVTIAIINAYFTFSAAALILIFLIMMSYYNVPEAEYIVWSHALNARAFLWMKLRLAAFASFVLVLPITIAIIFSFPSEWKWIVIFVLLGYAYLFTLVVAKYSSYPQELNISQGILIAISLTFPPFLLLLFPYFFKRSTQQLTQYLP